MPPERPGPVRKREEPAAALPSAVPRATCLARRGRQEEPRELGLLSRFRKATFGGGTGRRIAFQFSTGLRFFFSPHNFWGVLVEVRGAKEDVEKLPRAVNMGTPSYHWKISLTFFTL